MTAVPPSCFDWTILGSGKPVIYGSCTIGTNHPIRTYAPSGRVIVVAQPSGQTPGYFAFLDTRYDTPPSGWNQIGQP